VAEALEVSGAAACGKPVAFEDIVSCMAAQPDTAVTPATTNGIVTNQID
jgi:hypothetical protein